MLDAVVIRFATAGVSDVSRAFASIEDRMVRSERAGTESAKRGSAERSEQTKKEIQAREKEYAKLVKDIDREEREATRATARERERREAIVRRSSELAGRYAAQLANEEIREAKRATAEIEREAEKRARANRATASSMGRSVMRGVGGIGSMAAHALSLGGGFLLADVAHEELNAGRLAAQLVNVVTTGKTPPAGANAANILGRAGQVAGETGMSKGDLVGASLAYSQHAKKGDFEGAMGNMGFFAKMSQVTGTDIKDIAMSAGTLQSQNEGLGTAGMQELLLSVYAQSKMGSASFSDVAKQMGTLGAMRSAFTGSASRNQRELMALGQIVAPGGSVDEMGTFTKDTAQEALVKHKKLAALGVKYSGGQIDMSPSELIAQVFAGSKGNLSQIMDVFGGRGGKLFGELEGQYKSAGGGAKGVDAVRSAIASVSASTMTPEDLAAQHAQTMAQPIEKLNVALESLKAMVAEQLTPWIEKFTDKLPAIVDNAGVLVSALGGFAQLIVDNPVPAALVLLAKSMGGVPGEIATALALGVAAIDWVAAADRATQRKNVAEGVEGGNAISAVNAKIREGKVTSADVQDLTNRAVAMGTQVANTGDKSYSVFDPRERAREATNLIDLISGGDRQRADSMAIASAVRDQARLAEAAARAALALEKIGSLDPARVGDMSARRTDTKHP